mmetsp:Transcript_13644/g.33561  ORF Transcript_13644/g.33561 Transcript_13644/m.33561 type:complete len:86 (+) Transcript_13644:301-558(+)
MVPSLVAALWVIGDLPACLAPLIFHLQAPAYTAAPKPQHLLFSCHEAKPQSLEIKQKLCANNQSNHTGRTKLRYQGTSTGAACRV